MRESFGVDEISFQLIDQLDKRKGDKDRPVNQQVGWKISGKQEGDRSG